MSQIKACGLLDSPYNFFIDHLAPLCSFLEIPILTPYPQNLFLYKRYYPNVNILVRNSSVRYLLENYTHVLYSSIPKPSFKEIIEEERKKYPEDKIWKSNIKLIHHFHGCSDKGYHSDWIKKESHIKDLDLLFIYGSRFEALLKDKGLYHLPKKVLNIGNYRYLYYLKNQEYLDHLVEEEIFSKFNKKQKTILYAPTWADLESSSSFLEIYHTLFEKLPKEFNLIVKLHPNMTYKTKTYDPSPILKIIKLYQNLPNVIILPFYPLVYPLLKKCDLYLGDHSSVGYDILTFKIPMFFLNVNERTSEDKGAYLFKCGRVIEKNEFSKLYEIIQSETKSNSYIETQKELYKEAFGSINSLQKTTKTIKQAIYDL